MQPVLEKVSTSVNASFNFEYVDDPCFYTTWHYHPEVEIILMLEGTGTGFVGDGFFNFKPGAMAMVGSNTPHVWLNEKKFYEEGADLRARCIVVKFREDFLGDNFFNLPEMVRFRKLFEKSLRGMVFTGESLEKLSDMVTEIVQEQDPPDRLLNLLQILRNISLDTGFKYISNRPFQEKGDQLDCDRIDKIYRFVMNNFSRKIELAEVAEVANLSPTAFCRYFKSRTNKTFSHFLNEIRIGHACKLLIERDLSISEVCYQSGFNYPSNFHKQFKKINKITPQAYQARYLETKSERAYLTEEPLSEA